MSEPSTDYVGVGAGKATGAVYVADTTVPLPTDATTIPTGYSCIGFTSDAGAEVSESSTSNSINAWEGAVEIYTTVSGYSEQVKFMPVEFNPDVLRLIWGDDAVEVSQDGTSWAVHHTAATLKPKHMFIDILERADVVHRIVLKSQLSARDSAKYDGKSPSGRNLTFKALAREGGRLISDYYARIS